MAVRKSPALSAGKKPAARGSLYTAQALADFCEVDLKTVHHWADRGKVRHFRTDGRHLRFRRNDVVRFLRAHGYPLPDVLVRARPTVAVALLPSMFADAQLSLDDLTRRLGSRFAVRRHASGASALAHMLSEAPDAIVLDSHDPTLGFPAVLTALKSDPETAWVVFALVSHLALAESVEPTSAEIVLAARDVAKLPGELARTLAVA